MWDLNTENIVQHIVDICKERGIPVSRLEKDLGYGNGYLNPKKVSDMKMSRLLDILNYLRISPEEFFDIEARFRELETCDDEDDTTMEEDDLLRDYRDASAEIREEAAAMLHRSAERNRKNEK